MNYIKKGVDMFWDRTC